MIRRLLSFYAGPYVRQLAGLYGQARYRPIRYVVRFWQTDDFSSHRPIAPMSARQRFIVGGLRMAMFLCAAAALSAGILAARGDFLGGWYFGAALLAAYPLLLAHIVPVIDGIWWAAHPKSLGRLVLCRVMESQVVRLRRRHHFKVVAVAGSIGKTSTKIAVAHMLQSIRRVRWQEGNYNDRVTVPLIFFGHTQPAIWNIFAWLRIIVHNEWQIRRPYPFQVVVVELGTDGPGFMQDFAYCKPDVALVTAITPEHMAFFGTLDAVAKEELTILHYAKRTFVNIDDTPAKYLIGRDYTGFGLHASATYRLSGYKQRGVRAQKLTLHLDKDVCTVTSPLLGQQGAKTTLAAATAAHALGIPAADIVQGLSALRAFAGRMQILAGISNTTLIDDSYNASPVAVKAALDVLQAGDAPQRIAVLGSMNELGDYTPQAHREVAEHCDPSKLDLVVTLGVAAKEYLAPVAREQGCRVESFMSPYAVGAYLRDHIKEGAVILVKGSQNGVFSEEVLKFLLADPSDTAKLVRQSTYWMNIKRKQFPDFSQK